MSYAIVPHAAGTDRAALWLGAFDVPQPPANLVLRVVPGGIAPGAPLDLPAHAWQLINPGQHLPAPDQVHFRQVLEAVGLAPDREYTANLLEGPKILAWATFRTLPPALPPLGAVPFTVLLGSCFHRDQDREGLAGLSFRGLPLEDRPAFKILCGDQVYLDQPTWQNFPQDDLWLARNFLNRYVQTWTQRDPMGGGFGRLLSDGANLFASDDHEFWNDFPNPATLVQNSWTAGGRKQWKALAQALFQAFQSSSPLPPPHVPPSSSPLRPLNVPPISFLVLDTRFDRVEGESRFLPDLVRLKDWVDQLNQNRWIGFLCLGQPLFDQPGSWFQRRFVDRSLADYDQYAELVQILETRRQALVILTGDVHYGRVARLDTLRAPLLEVISSPLALVDPRVGGKASPPPPAYPARALPGAVQSRVEVLRDRDDKPALLAQDQFLTLSFWSTGGSVRMRLKYWSADQPRAGPLCIVEHDLLRNP
jgi:hypothetical protein